MQVVQALVSLLFMDFEMAGGMKGDIVCTPAFCPDTQGNLLAHRATGHKNCCFFSQEPSNARFKTTDDFPLTITVILQLWICCRCQFAKNLPGSAAIMTR